MPAPLEFVVLNTLCCLKYADKIPYWQPSSINFGRIRLGKPVGCSKVTLQGGTDLWTLSCQVKRLKCMSSSKQFFMEFIVR